ncbi:MAG: hypothetical protein CVU44_06060 [Chloroflexi bacterium HGW-Chloroflexi-6]|nr:MAG: hypothetical protein CVU44_06060 [Chloroflexi bacterium HGW-Chloroflexi-6]
MNIKYAVWSAVSKDHQAKPDKVSLSEQIAIAHKRSMTKGWESTDLEYIVPGESRTRYVNLRDAENEIPQLKQMLDDAQNGKFNLLVVFDYNRLRDLLDPVAKTLAAYGVQLYSLSQPVEPIPTETFSPYTSDSESIMRGMAQILSRAQISDIQRKIAYAMPKRILGGLPHMVPHGYIPVQGRPAIIDPVRSQACIIAKDMALDGKSLRQICSYLDAEGHPAPKGKRWYPQTVQGILENIYYAGQVTWLNGQITNDPRTGKRKLKPTPDRAIHAEGKHQALWTLEEHHQLVAEMSKREKNYIGKRAYLFSGLLFCGNCGANMSLHAPRLPGNQYVSPELGRYRCRKNGNSCNVIAHTELFPLVLERLRTALLEVESEKINAISPDGDLTELIDRRNRLTEAYLAKAYKLAEYLEIKKDLDSAIEQAEGKVANLEYERSRQAEKIKHVNFILKNWDDFVESLQTDNPQANNQALRSILTRIIISPGPDVRLEFD